MLTGPAVLYSSLTRTRARRAARPAGREQSSYHLLDHAPDLDEGIVLRRGGHLHEAKGVELAGQPAQHRGGMRTLRKIALGHFHRFGLKEGLAAELATQDVDRLLHDGDLLFGLGLAGSPLLLVPLCLLSGR